ncbi:MAG: fasciclin domain-containing protein [Bacteroidales bacterium]|nr:fasciclin domain-containing protein [Bacteroidales bacterium]
MKTFHSQPIFQYLTLIIVMSLGIMSSFTSCEKSIEGKIYQVYDDKMIDEILQDQNLSQFLAVVEKAELTGTIHAYGAYTIFAPTNDAIIAYLQKNGKNSVEDLNKEEAEAIVKYHLIRDTLSTADFVDGRLASPNFLKKYLTTKAESEGTAIFQRINRQAKVIQENFRGNNGFVHIIDQVLTPPENSITDAIRALPEDYSLMKTLFERSGWADSLDKEIEDQWFTFFIQDNEAFNNAGIYDEEDLLEQLRVNTPEVTDDEELIRNYIGYHGINNLLYIADLMVISSMNTLVPKQIITFKRNLDVILLNELVQGKFNEPGIPLIRESDYSDLSCSNGVIQKIDGNIVIKNRTAYRIYWDLTEQPEIIANKGFRKAGTSLKFNPGDLSEITWGGKAPAQIEYYCGGYSNVLDEKFQYVYGDYLRFVLHPNVTSWVEFKTPVLIEGKYKVWLCYRRELDATVKSTFKQEGKDDQVLPYVFDMAAYMSNPEAEGSSHELIEIEGWKQYNAKKYNSVVCSHILGIIDVQSTGRHTLRIETTGTRHNNPGNWDVIQFIPVDDDQLWPRMDIKGNWIEKDVPNCQIWPPTPCDTVPTE